jgi:hypothetical protein
MKLEIPKDQAIKILKDRLRDLTAYDFNAKVWKDRTVLDLKQIFGILGEQSMQVSFIHFDTPIQSEKAKTLREAKLAALGLLNSYIDYIEEYSKVAIQQKENKDQSFEQKYYNILKEWNEFVPKYNLLLKDHEASLEKAQSLSVENKRLIDNTLQLDNVTLKRLWTGVQSLPTKQVIVIISVFISILIASFLIGRLVENTSSKNDLFDLKTETTDLQKENKNLQNQIGTQKETIILQTDSIRKLKNAKDSL